jgi:osmotically-inducible protein OsmY
MVHAEHNITEQHDRDLERRVVNYLMGRQMPTLRQIHVEADQGTVRLRGEVRSFYQKQLCLNCTRRVAGVLDLVDELNVVSATGA